MIIRIIQENLILSIAFFCVFLLILLQELFLLELFTYLFYLRPMPELILAVLVFRRLSDLNGRLLFFALLFGFAGSLVMALKEIINPQLFVVGLSLFLIGHIFYILLFARQFLFRTSRVPIALLIFCYSIFMLIFLYPYLTEKNMHIPVYLYILIITLMAVFASFRSAEGRIVLYGVLLFLLSDSLIAISDFVYKFPHAIFLILITYYPAQFLIVTGSIVDARSEG